MPPWRRWIVNSSSHVNARERARGSSSSSSTSSSSSSSSFTCPRVSQQASLCVRAFHSGGFNLDPRQRGGGAKRNETRLWRRGEESKLGCAPLMTRQNHRPLNGIPFSVSLNEWLSNPSLFKLMISFLFWIKRNRFFFFYFRGVWSRGWSFGSFFFCVLFLWERMLESTGWYLVWYSGIAFFFSFLSIRNLSFYSFQCSSSNEIRV